MSVIIGAKTLEQLNDNLAAVKVALTADEVAALDKASALKPEYPGWMLERQAGAALADAGGVRRWPWREKFPGACLASQKSASRK